MSSKLVKVCIQAKLDDEQLYFAEEDAKLIRELRDKNKKESDSQYRENHSYHCFRCGTQSLVEVVRGDIKIDSEQGKGATFELLLKCAQ